MSDKTGDFAFRSDQAKGRWHEMTYGGALSFLRRRYTRDLAGVDVTVSGVPYDAAVTYRSGARLGPRAIRAASVQLAELDAFPFGFDPFDTLSVVDAGDCMLDPHHPETIADAIHDHADAILGTGSKMLTLGGDHFVAYPLIKAHAKHHGPIALVQFDAHCDTWADDGRQLDHGTMFARAAAEGIIDVSKSTQIGLRTYNDSDHGFEILTAPWVHRNGIDAALETIIEIADAGQANFAPIYPDEMGLFEKIETIAKRIYRADEVLADKTIRDQLKTWEEQGYGNLPVCMAKTQYSFSTDPNLRGAPTGHSVPVREVRLSAGAGFIVVVCGQIMTMPGLPRKPAAESIRLNDAGEIEGLF